MSREWRFYLQDMVTFCDRVLSYTEGMDRTEFEASGLTYDATVRNIELIGEAARHIPEEVRALSPDIDWRKLDSTRNILIHDYLSIDNDILWDIVRNKIPLLKEALGRLERIAP